MKLFGSYLFISLFLISCNSSQSDSTDYLTADIRNEINHMTTLKLSDEIESVFYVPLEVTADNESLIDGVYDFSVTNKYIYVLPIKEPRIVLFDRQGHYIKTLISEGQGPGEFSGFLSCIQADEKDDRLYLFSGDRRWEYTLNGKFIRQVNSDYQVFFERKIGQDRFAAIAFPYSSFQNGCFGLGVFSGKGDTIITKNNFFSPLLPHEKSGFTVNIAATYSKHNKSLLFKTGSNDTIFRISEDKIQPACVLNLKNSDKEIIKALDITDFSDLHGERREDKDIFISDMFETPNRYYFRFRYSQGHCIASVDKKTGKTYVEKCEQPATLKELAGTTLLHGMLGTKSYQNFPIWGRMEETELVQVITPYELNFYNDNCSISIPEELNINEEDGNPIFIFYKIKANC